MFFVLCQSWFERRRNTCHWKYKIKGKLRSFLSAVYTTAKNPGVFLIAEGVVADLMWRNPSPWPSLILLGSSFNFLIFSAKVNYYITWDLKASLICTKQLNVSEGKWWSRESIGLNDRRCDHVQLLRKNYISWPVTRDEFPSNRKLCLITGHHKKRIPSYVHVLSPPRVCLGAKNDNPLYFHPGIVFVLDTYDLMTGTLPASCTWYCRVPGNDDWEQ